MKILLIGKTGQLGGAIVRDAEALGHEVHCPSRDVLDIERPGSVSGAISDFGPDVVINTAAFHYLPDCESNHYRAYGINFIAVRDLALASRRAGVRFVTVSTDYVFSGEKGAPYQEDDLASPIQVYGLSKLAGEYAALCAWPDGAVVVRTCGLYGLFGAQSKGGNFVDKRIGNAKAGGSIEMGADQTVSPTYTGDLGKAMISLISAEGLTPGVYHLVNEGQCTWYEFTKAIYELSGIDMEVKPVDRKGMGEGVRRPLYSALLNTKAKALGVALPHWKDALGRYLSEKYPHGVK